MTIIITTITSNSISSDSETTYRLMQLHKEIVIL